VRVSYSIDPVLIYQRSFVRDGMLVLGHVQWPTDEPELARQTKPDYQMIVKWIRANWTKVGDSYFGVEAERLFRAGARVLNF